MGELVGRFLAGPVGSFFRVFVSAVLGGMLTYFANGGTFRGLGFDDIEPWLGIAFTAALPVLISSLNPEDPRYGVGAES